MKALPKNWLLLSKYNCSSFINQKALTCLLVFWLYTIGKGQIVNYVNNGSFEVPKSNNNQKPEFWDGTDTTKYMGILLSQTITPYLVPNSSYTHQWPEEGSNYLISTLLWKPNTPNSNRGYPKNKLKQTLGTGKTYCIKFYVNVTDQSSYGADGLGAYFGDSSIDTIKSCNKPLTYLSPQVQYSSILTDTLNWVLVQGTFTAVGNETNLIIGNFKSDPATNTLLINPTNSVVVFCDVLYDNVSVIDINLPAFAGRDTFFIPGDSIYLGRPNDAGIDEACMWYKLPNTTQAVDTTAGFWLKPTTTCTYVVKQDICGNIKYDTIVLNQSAIGINELDLYSQNIKLYPQPAQDALNIELGYTTKEKFIKMAIYDNLGQIVREEEIFFNSNKSVISLTNLVNGAYTIILKTKENGRIAKKLVVTH